MLSAHCLHRCSSASSVAAAQLSLLSNRWSLNQFSNPTVQTTLTRHNHHAIRQFSSSTPSPLPPRPYTVPLTNLHPSHLSYPLVARFVDEFRTNAHLIAQLDPLPLQQQNNASASTAHHRIFDPASYGLSLKDVVPTAGLVHMNKETATVKEIADHLHRTYASSIGAELSHLSPDEYNFLTHRLETASPLSPSTRLNTFNWLLQSEIFDHFLGKKFTSFKRYALEGAEAMIPMVNEILTVSASEHSVESTVIGMPHRGRLNLLVSLLSFSARALFYKIKGASLIPRELDGVCDVVSHIATTVTRRFGSRDQTVSLLHNPSHLEAVNAVSAGKTRCRQDELNAADLHSSRRRVMCLQLHGDAAFSGQGIVTETLQSSLLPSFTVGGTVHLIVNNQLGFTSDCTAGRSSAYCSDVVKMIGAPVLHVNANDVEACLKVCQVAAAYRAEFQKDIVIDLLGYRRYGHNEVDEPAFTQPKMYSVIRQQLSVVTLYGQQLTSEGLLKPAQIEKLTEKFNSFLESELQASSSYQPDASIYFRGKWSGLRQPQLNEQPVNTGVPVTELITVAEHSVQLPSSFTPHQRLARTHVQARKEMLKKAEKGESTIDWSTAETMAFGSLLNSGVNVRLCGQDVERGTFSQRHCALVDSVTEHKCIPLQHANYKGRFIPVNSHLSELAVLGFEWGYSSESPNSLCLWEAQFGDFNQAAQIIIDTYVANSETKWMRQSGLVMLLPHGMDGAGPEHSSSRIERFLQLSDDEAFDTSNTKQTNFSVIHPTTPAQYFHALRRQMLRQYRRPLIVISPKVLLRLEQCTSTLKEMGLGTSFQSVLDDQGVQAAKVKTVVLLSGKVYYDCVARRTADNRTDIAFIRLEQLAPFPFTALRKVLQRYTAVESIVWFQEEQCNQGAFWFVQPRVATLLTQMEHTRQLGVNYVGRAASAVSATGTFNQHKTEVKVMMGQLFSY